MAGKLEADIKDAAINFVAVNFNTKIDAKDCSIEQRTSRQELLEIGGSTVTDSSTLWIVTITSEMFPHPLLVKVELYADGNVEVTDFR
jgi:hypothetical protein